MAHVIVGQTSRVGPQEELILQLESEDTAFCPGGNLTFFFLLGPSTDWTDWLMEGDGLHSKSTDLNVNHI
jgi:hypothetical protein